MGKATRWLKGFLGMKIDKEKEKESLDTSSSVSSERREKRRWSFGKSARNSNVAPPPLPVNVPGGINPAKDAARPRSYFADTEREQNKHAIAVAAATAAAADAAVAAAQAAVAVVRLTSQGRGRTLFAGSGGGGRERSAAVKIQTVFRGYLARKALRALKGLVKLQALVRGYLVRKRAAATLQSMQALIRAQANIRSQRAARRSFNKENRYQPETRARRSIERYEDARSEFHSKRLSTSYELNAFDDSPKIVEIDTCKPLSRSRRMAAAVVSECGEDCHYYAISSPLPCPMPARISVPECRNLQDPDWYLSGDECRCSTAQSTPRFGHSMRCNGAATPAKSVCGDSYLRPYSNCPNYMADTQSFRAKLRSHSAPKQRPDPLQKKRLSLNEIIASRNSIRMQRPGDHDLGL